MDAIYALEKSNPGRVSDFKNSVRLKPAEVQWMIAYGLVIWWPEIVGDRQDKGQKGYFFTTGRYFVRKTKMTVRCKNSRH